MKNKFLNQDIEILGLDISTLADLKNKNISLIKDLWVMNRRELKNIELTDCQINQIIIKLQLIGLDINKRSYN
ncbi:MAG: hypothetical protein E7165_03975 [Firmicutes bacterium]|nr:hypothetical protein [Bacillota bacterium]